MKIDMQKIVIFFLTAGLLGGGSFILYKQFKYQKEAAPAAVEISEVREKPQESGEPEEEITPEKEEIEMPEELNLKLPFYAQAPFGNWDYPWQEACEEASVLLVANVYYGHNWTADEFNDEILKMVEWQNEKFGDYWHTTMEQTSQILNEYLGLKTVTHENPDFEDIQKILAKGHLIIMPLAGQKLGNPFYTNGGPVYHVLVVKGYKAGEKIITHDVGTRRGEDYIYSWQTIRNALHDYAIPIEDGGQRIIEVFPPDEEVPDSLS